MRASTTTLGIPTPPLTRSQPPITGLVWTTSGLHQAAPCTRSQASAAFQRSPSRPGAWRIPSRTRAERGSEAASIPGGSSHRHAFRRLHRHHQANETEAGTLSRSQAQGRSRAILPVDDPECAPSPSSKAIGDLNAAASHEPRGHPDIIISPY